MRLLLKSRSWYIAVAIGLIGIAAVMLFDTLHKNKIEYVITEATRGEVRELVSVSGVVEAKNLAELAFPLSGIIDKVLVKVGDSVDVNDTLITLRRDDLLAEKAEAEARLLSAKATEAELIAGPQAEARTVTSIQVENARLELARVKSEEAEKVRQATLAYLNADLEALSQDNREDAMAPIISGTYTCETPGKYLLEVYSSNAYSGYSYRLSGLETGTYAAYTDQPGAFGSCGLFVSFDPSSSYERSIWEINIPNQRAADHVKLKNALAEALESQTNAVEKAKDDFTLAQAEMNLDNAEPRIEALARAQGTIAEIEAQISAIDAAIKDHSIVSPFSGIITNVDILPGETASTEPVITLLANDRFEITARIPEIDITKIAVGQEAELLFDAKPDEIKPAIITFVSPQSIEIDGVAYFEAILELSETTPWLRSGLNADIAIITAQVDDVIIIPKRFLQEENGNFFVLVPGNPDPVKQTVKRIFSGNEGLVAIEGISEGSTVIAP